MTETATRTQIGSTGVEIAPLTLGGNVFAWTADRAASFDVLDAFVAGGGDSIDTADGYSHWVPGHTGGESETILGEWFTARGNREEVYLATKVSTHPSFAGLAAANVHAAAEASLKRLQTDYIDLYYAHFDDEQTPLEQTVEAFSRLVDEGKVRAIGVSNYTAERIDEWFRIARAGGFHLPVALQPHYNLVERDFESNGLRTVAEREGLAVFPYFSLAKGFLAGKYRETSDVSAVGASLRAGQAAEYLSKRGLGVLGALDEVAANHEVSVAAVALAWLRDQPTVAAPIASARSAEQLPALLDSLRVELTSEELGLLARASA